MSATKPKPKHRRTETSEETEEDTTPIGTAQLQFMQRILEQQASMLEQYATVVKKQGRMVEKQEKRFDEQGKKIEEHDIAIAENKNELEERKNEIAELIQAKTVKGVTTQAQFYQHLIDQKILEQKTDKTVTFLGLTKIDSLPPSVEPKELSNSDRTINEQTVQNEFERCLGLLRESSLSLLKSVPSEGAYQRPSFASRKPDLVCQEKGCTGSMSITFFGDCKKRGTGGFSDEEIGHVLDMGRVFMEKVGLHRQKLIVFLTDGMRWQFFKVKRSEGDVLLYEESKLIDNAKEGWNIFWSLLQMDVAAVGHMEPKVDGVTLKAPLGRGGSATVYEGIYGEEKVFVKIFRESMASSFDTERRALEILQDVDGVPKIKIIASVLESNQLECHHEALVMSPVGKVLRTNAHRMGKILNGSHLKQLVEIVRQAHQKKLLHRDIKPDNAFLTDDNRMLLNDWGSSILSNGSRTLWEGTYGYGVSPAQQSAEVWSGETCDLVALVRTAYVLICKECPPTDNSENADKHWEERIRVGTVWSDAMGLAVSKEYEKLGELLFTLK